MSAGPEGDDLTLVPEAGEVFDPAPGVDVGGVREIEDSHPSILAKGLSAGRTLLTRTRVIGQCLRVVASEL